MKPTDRATPTPWDVHETPSYGFEIHPLDDEDGTKPIADVTAEFWGEATAQANAALIVQAVNSHEALVKSVRDFLALDFYPHTGDCTQRDCAVCNAIFKARSALKLAGE